MKRYIFLSVMLLATSLSWAQTEHLADSAKSFALDTAKAQREAKKEAYAANISHIIESRDYVFRPVTMQNVITGNTRDIYAYYLYAALLGDKVVLHLPVEFTSFVIDTINLDTFAEEYKTSLIDGNWRITFTMMNGSEKWFVEFFISTITGQARLAIVTPEGVMRYLGTIESGNALRTAENTPKARKNKKSGQN